MEGRRRTMFEEGYLESCSRSRYLREGVSWVVMGGGGGLEYSSQKAMVWDCQRNVSYQRAILHTLSVSQSFLSVSTSSHVTVVGSVAALWIRKSK